MIRERVAIPARRPQPCEPGECDFEPLTRAEVGWCGGTDPHRPGRSADARLERHRKRRRASLHRAILGVGIGVVLEHLLDDLGLELAVGALGDFDQVEVLDRIVVGVELEAATQRVELGLHHGGPQRLPVRDVTLHLAHGAVDQERRVIGLECVGRGDRAELLLVGGDEALVLRIVEIGRPVGAAEEAERGILLGRQRRLHRR